MDNWTNLDEDYFNKSFLTLLNGQQDLQKQSFNMMQDMTHRHEYDNLLKDIPIYEGKNMELADWLLQTRKMASLTHSQEYKLVMAKLTSIPLQNVEKMR